MDFRRTLLVGFTLVRFAGDVVPQAQGDIADGGNRVRQGLNASGVDCTHLFHDVEKAVDLAQQAFAVGRTQLQARQIGNARDVGRCQ